MFTLSNLIPVVSEFLNNTIIILMKTVYTFFFLIIMLDSTAQWSNTNNQFYDSLHMAVCTEAGNQANPIIIKSFPDSGYFIVWEDHRKGFYSPAQIFAQKFDKNGKQLWANNGVPVSTGANSQHFTYSTNADYRNYKRIYRSA